MSGDVIQDARRARASHIHAYQTIAMLREHLAESQLETREAREVRADEEPWIWCDDDTAQTVQTMGNRMTARISGGHLRALLRDAALAHPTAMGSLDADAILEYDAQRTHPCSSETASIIRAIADKPHFAPVEIEGVIMESARFAEANASLRRENRALRAAVRDLETMLDIAKGSK